MFGPIDVSGRLRGVVEVLRCADRWGREVVLYQDTWYDKIVAYHVHMADQIDAIAAVLSDPVRVNYDAMFANGENFYGRGTWGRPFDFRYLKVVVRYDIVGTEEVGTIVTAYAARHYRKHGERHKWHRR